MAVRSGTNSYDREAVVGCGDSHRPAAAFLPDIVASGMEYIGRRGLRR